MKLLTKLFLLTVLLFGCIPEAALPTPAPENYGAQRFVDYCQKGYWTGQQIAYQPIENVSDNSCITYTLVNFRVAEEKTSRISGLNVEINSECVTIDSIVTEGEVFERLRCSFDPSVNLLNVYLKGEDLRVITEIVVDGQPVYFPAIGVERE